MLAEANDTTRSFTLEDSSEGDVSGSLPSASFI